MFMNTPVIIPRTQWGAQPWATPVYHIDIAARDYFFVHYNGHAPTHNYGVSMAKDVERGHLAQGWAGVGYNFMVGQDGQILEGRGWELVGAHCPGFNTRGVGVYGAVGDDQQLTPAAKASIRWLREEHARLRYNKILNTTYHGAHFPTACCGVPTIAWVNQGLPISGGLPMPIPKPTPPIVRPPVKASLVIDGKLGLLTCKALQTRLVRAGFSCGNYGIDGKFGSDSVKALQRYLNAKLGGANLIVDGVGFAQDNKVYKTVAALQLWLGTPTDGRLSTPVSVAIQRMQDRLNRGNF